MSLPSGIYNSHYINLACFEHLLGKSSMTRGYLIFLECQSLSSFCTLPKVQGGWVDGPSQLQFPSENVKGENGQYFQGYCGDDPWNSVLTPLPLYLCLQFLFAHFLLIFLLNFLSLWPCQFSSPLSSPSFPFVGCPPPSLFSPLFFFFFSLSPLPSYLSRFSRLHAF